MADQIQKSPIEWDVFREGTASAVQTAEGSTNPTSSSSAPQQSSSSMTKAKATGGFHRVGGASSSSTATSSSPEVSQSSSSDNPIANMIMPPEEGIIDMRYREVDIDKVGEVLYNDATNSFYPVLRSGVGVLVVVAFYFGETAVVKMAEKRLMKKGLLAPADVRAGVETAQTASRKATRAMRSKKGRTAWAKLHQAANWVAQKVHTAANPSPKAGTLRKIGGKIVWVAAGGVSVGTQVAFWSELSEWWGDAATDFAMSRQFFFNDNFSRETHLKRLKEIFLAGQLRKIPGDTAGQLAYSTFSPAEVIALTMLASEKVVGSESFDLETTRMLTNAVAQAMKTAAEKNMKLQDVLQQVEIKLPIADPASLSLTADKAKFLDSEVHALLRRFMRQVEDINDFDAEDILVPIAMCFDRLSFVPGVLSKAITAVALGSDAIFADSFEEETKEMIAQISEADPDEPNLFDRLMNFVSNVSDIIVGNDEQKAINPFIEGGPNVGINK